MVGTTIRQYRIIEKVGEGGMGVVYKAQDTLLGRPVAVKFLSARREASRKRFVREAKAASALDHPNICTVHAFEIAPDGRMFMVMPFYEGETLKDKITRGPLPVSEAVDIALQVARGLSKAHARGIIHRDIKPGNVIVNPDGLAKILDFGVAKLAHADSLVTGGHRIGTLAYMSPEQVSGRDVDHRTDLWSLGAVLYEMLAGRRPFDIPGADSIETAIIGMKPVSLATVRVDVPQELQQTIDRALSKHAAARHPSAEALIADLERTREQLGSNMPTSLAQAPPAPSIVVLPLANVGPDEEGEFFSDGLTDELTNALAQVGGLRVVCRTSAFEFKGKAVDARTIAGRLNVTGLLEGSVRRAGSRVRVIVQFVNAVDGCEVWSERYDRDIEDVFTIQEEIARSVAGTLKIRLSSSESRPLVRRPTASMEAYYEYLRGRFNWFKNTGEGLQSAAECFQRAVDADPGFAAAWSGLADYHLALGFWGICPPAKVWPEARELAARALSLDDRIAEAHVSLGYLALLCDWDRAEAEREFLRAIQLNPSHSNAYFAYAVCLTQATRLEDALRKVRQAQELDPLSFTIGTAAGWLLYYLGRYDDAIAECQKVLEFQPAYFETHACIGMAFERKGDVGEAIKWVRQAAQLPGGDAFGLGLLGWICGTHRMQDEANKAMQELRALSESRYVPPGALLLVTMGLNDARAAAVLLDQAFANHDPLLCYANVFPPFEPLRSDPRFQLTTASIRSAETATIHFAL